MTGKKVVSFLLVLVLLLSCIKFIPAQAVHTESAENTELAPTIQNVPPHVDEDKSEEPKHVDKEQFEKADHVARIHDEERLDTYVFLNRDGSKSVYYMGQNVKYRHSDGSMREKDTTLDRDGRGYRMRDNDVALHIPDTPADGITLGYGSRSVKLLPLGGNGSAVLADNSVTYPEYFGEDTALRYTPLLSGVKEDIILSSYTGINNFEFLLETGGLYLYEADGQYFLAESEGAEAEFYLGQILVYDAAGRPSEGSMTIEVSIPGQCYKLSLSADEDFLTDPETVYPVTIDPTLTVSYTTHGVNAIEDAPIYEGYPDTNYSNYVYDRVGYYDDSYKTARTVMRTTALLNSAEWQSLSAGNITGLTLYIKASSNKTAKQIDIHALTENTTWTETSITWNNVGAYSQTVYSSANLSGTDWTSFDLTQMAIAWKNGTLNAQNGFLLKLTDESVYRTIDSCECTTIENRPYVVLTYTLDMSLNHYTKDIDEGSTFTLSASTSEGTLSNVTWTSSNEAVATVSESGVVTGIHPGTTIITATSPDATVSQGCVVYVTVADGVYRLQNKLSNLYLGAYQGGVDDDTVVTQQTLSSSGPLYYAQLWKVQYLEDGYYSIRPMHRLSSGLSVSGSDVYINDIGTAGTFSSVPEESRWTIEY